MPMNGSLVTGDGRVTVVPPKTTTRPPPPKKSSCLHGHLNSLWSIWYGVCACALQAYIAVQLVYRFLDYIDLDWPDSSFPHLELHAYEVFTGISVLLLPVFFAAAVFKVGNLANDGFKLGRNLSTCSVDPPSAVSLGASGLRGFWRHSGPTAPLIHVVSAFCLLLPRVLIEARLIQAGFLPKDLIWRTDLDFIINQHDTLVLSFMTSTQPNTTFLPTPLPQNTSSPHSLPLSVGIPGHEVALNEENVWGPVSPEIINYALALLVYSVRYPAVFWSTNKCFGALFSLQLLINGVQTLVMYAGVCILYKIHVIGPAEALSTLHPRIGLSFGMPQSFLLNRDVTLALFILSTALVFKSSLVLYLYGYGRMNSFMNRERARRVISLQGHSTGHGWSYFTYCAAFCVLVAIIVCQAPIIYDCTVVYRKSVNTAVLLCVIGTVVHLFLWVLLWLILTIKQHWVFKLRVTVGRAAVRSARSIKLVTDVDLLSSTDAAAPLLIVGNGRTYTVSDNSPKKAIMGVIQKYAMEKKARNGQGTSHTSKDWMDRDEEQIYWLRPKPPSPKNSPDSSTSDRVDWFRKPTTTKHKVTFDPSSKKGSGKDGESDDDGDYARLRELPMLNTGVAEQSDDTASEDNKATPRCLRRADSGMPQEELTPRSDSVSTEASGGSPPDNSETSSGVHSNSSRDSAQRRSTSVDDLATDAANKVQPQWRSSSLQRGMVPPQPDQSYNAFRASQPQHIVDQTYSNVKSIQQQEPTYLNYIPRVSLNPHEQIYAPYRPQQLYTKSPPVIKEAAEEDVVIRRKVERQEAPVVVSGAAQEPFGRATNVRLTTFTDRPQQSATLPHYPTQTVNPAYPHCSTMPLPGISVNPQLMGAGASCNSFPRQHTTIPTHHNGIRLFNPNPYTKRLFPASSRGYVVPDPVHHTFPQIINLKCNPQHKSERDSANFSLASSGDSDSHA